MIRTTKAFRNKFLFALLALAVTLLTPIHRAQASPGLCEFMRSVCETACFNAPQQPQDYTCLNNCQTTYDSCMLAN
jgi:hypothetical protein